METAPAGAAAATVTEGCGFVGIAFYVFEVLSEGLQPQRVMFPEGKIRLCA